MNDDRENDCFCDGLGSVCLTCLDALPAFTNPADRPVVCSCDEPDIGPCPFCRGDLHG